jgi:hypothetical protein
VQYTKRHHKQANDYNHATSFLAAAKTTKPGKEIKTAANFLPYLDPDKINTLSPHLQALIHRLRKEGKIPSRMMADLLNHGLIDKPE